MSDLRQRHRALRRAMLPWIFWLTVASLLVHLIIDCLTLVQKL